MKRIFKMLKIAEDSMDADLLIKFFSDGSGSVVYFSDEEVLVQFESEKDLIFKLQGLRILKTNKYQLN